MQILPKEGQVLAGPDVVHLGKGVHEVPDKVGLALVKAGHAEAVKADKADPKPEV